MLRTLGSTRAAAYHFDRAIVFAKAIVRGSLPGASSVSSASVSPLIARETPSTRVISSSFGGGFQPPASSSFPRCSRRALVTALDRTPRTITR